MKTVSIWIKCNVSGSYNCNLSWKWTRPGTGKELIFYPLHMSGAGARDF